LIPIQASRAATVRVLSGGGSEPAIGRIVSSSSPRIVVETTISAGMHGAVEVICEGVVILGEVVEERLSPDGYCVITAEVLHRLNVDSVAGHSRFWSSMGEQGERG
jgi:hypothetical protein